jgi:SAM-dependent methyltransferase
MNPDVEASQRLFKFYRDCLREIPPVAPIDTIRDSQTARVLAEIFVDHRSPAIVDYGCGALRLLNALLTKCPEREWSYCGLDLEPPEIRFSGEHAQLAELPQRDRWTTDTLSSARQADRSFDVAVLMNVLHELPIADVATAFQDIRRLLKPGGVFLLIDTVLLHEGEPRFVPFYPWEVEELTYGAENRSYVSKSGIPISVFRIQQRNLPCYWGMTSAIHTLMAVKRDHWSRLSAEMSRKENPEQMRALGLGKHRELDYAYLNAIIANASYRVQEFAIRPQLDARRVDECAHAIVMTVQHTFHNEGHVPSAELVFDRLGEQFEYAVIEEALMALQGPVPAYGVLLPITDPRRSLTPSSAWDMLEDVIGVSSIQQRGVRAAVSNAVALDHGDRSEWET